MNCAVSSHYPLFLSLADKKHILVLKYWSVDVSWQFFIRKLRVPFVDYLNLIVVDGYLSKDEVKLFLLKVDEVAYLFLVNIKADAALLLYFQIEGGQVLTIFRFKWWKIFSLLPQLIVFLHQLLIFLHQFLVFLFEYIRSRRKTLLLLNILLFLLCFWCQLQLQLFDSWQQIINLTFILFLSFLELLLLAY